MRRSHGYLRDDVGFFSTDEINGKALGFLADSDRVHTRLRCIPEWYGIFGDGDFHPFARRFTHAHLGGYSLEFDEIWLAGLYLMGDKRPLLRGEPFEDIRHEHRESHP